MTNYNERLDEIIRSAYHGNVSWIYDQLDGTSFIGAALGEVEKNIVDTKQAITSLNKELVAEALKELKEEVIGEVPSKMNTDNWKYDRRVAELKLWQHQAIDQFEQNLLKALETLE